MNVALPTLVRELHASQRLLWIVDAYTIVYAGMAFTASMSGRFGRKGALSVGLVVFGLGSMASAFSGSAVLPIVAGGGMGGCIVLSATLSILTKVFSVKERGTATGIWAGACRSERTRG